MTILEKLKTAMKGKNWGIRKVAAEAGLNPGNVWRVVHGRARLTPNLAEKIGRALDVELSPQIELPFHADPWLRHRKPELDSVIRDALQSVLRAEVPEVAVFDLGTEGIAIIPSAIILRSKSQNRGRFQTDGTRKPA